MFATFHLFIVLLKCLPVPAASFPIYELRYVCIFGPTYCNVCIIDMSKSLNISPKKKTLVFYSCQYGYNISQNYCLYCLLFGEQKRLLTCSVSTIYMKDLMMFISHCLYVFDLVLSADLFSGRLAHSEYLELWRPEEEDKPRATLAHHAGKTCQKREEEELPAERSRGA